jgi:uncharacterized protein (UPF0276 family)
MSANTAAPAAPAGVGVGLRARHVEEVLAARPLVPWFEVHAENYMGGEMARRALREIRQSYPIALHGVGLSLGTTDGIDRQHLRRLKALVEWLDPALISEHLAWSRSGSVYLNHLLPLPYTEESLEVMCRHVDQAQEAIGRRILLENPSSYLRFRHSPIPEPEFLAEVAQRTGCGILCDVNNVYVSAQNLGLDPLVYLDALPSAEVEEVHLAGHMRNDADGQTILIDDHGSPVSPDVWDLYRHAVARFGPVPALIEWDTDIPPLAILLEEASRAERIRGGVQTRHDHASAA